MSLDASMIKKIDEVFYQAEQDNRNVLYEYEVYNILSAAGLDVPHYEFVQNIDEVDKKMLSKFGRELIVKIVSPDIAHKQKLGGVKKVDNVEPLYVQFVLNKMAEEVLTHFPEDSKPRVSGFLLVEFVPHSQALGYEVLIGIKQDPSFGPVLTLSKGGDDAEFFAKHYDPANLFLPPISVEKARDMANTLKIKYKFDEAGHKEYIELIAKATSVMSNLASMYSFMNSSEVCTTKYIIKAMDINPFVITKEGKFVALDGFAEFVNCEQAEKGVRKLNTEWLDSFFHPNGIAVVGVSTDYSKYSLGRDIAQLLVDLGRKDLYFINPKGGSVLINDTEYPLFQNIAQLPNDIQLAVYAAPAHQTVEFIKTLPEKGPQAVILISGIPSDIKYPDFAKQLDAVKRPGLRIIGPNCMGVFYAPENDEAGINTLFINEERLEIKHSQYSNAALITQSGALAVTAIDKLRNSKLFKSVVSFGNKYDVNITDLISYFSKQPSVEVLSVYIEGLDKGEGRQFLELASEIEKPLLVYKSGKTEAGAKAAASHTASMSGSYDVFKAACKQAGVILAEDILDHYDYLKIFSLLANKKPKGNRVAGVVNAGFESTVGADELKKLKQAVLEESTVQKLDRINSHGLVDTSTPFLDITPMAGDKMYAEYVRAVVEDPNVDCVFVAIVPHAVTLKTTPDTCYDPDSLANLLVKLSKEYDKPLVVSVNAGRHYQDFVSIMELNGLPVYNDIRSAIKSLDVFVDYHMGLAPRG